MKKKRALRVAIQMDPMDCVEIDCDSTFVLALEAQKRGYSLFHYGPRLLSLDEGRVLAKVRPLHVRREKGNHFTEDPARIIDLSTVDVLLMRQNPPFDMAYITATHILQHIQPTTLVVNNPVSVRNAPEKLLVTHFVDLMPPTLISADPAQIKEFRHRHGEIIVKPLFGNGGAGVFHIRREDTNLGALLELFGERSPEPLMVQRYVPEIRQGDKRIILIEGEAKGAINRVPAVGEARANLHVGGRPEKADLTSRDRKICDAIGPLLRDQGLLFVGIDVIGGYLTEINVTSPTGLQEINRFDGTCLEALIWDAIEARLGMGVHSMSKVPN